MKNLVSRVIHENKHLFSIMEELSLFFEGEILDKEKMILAYTKITDGLTLFMGSASDFKNEIEIKIRFPDDEDTLTLFTIKPQRSTLIKHLISINIKEYSPDSLSREQMYLFFEGEKLDAEKKLSAYKKITDGSKLFWASSSHSFIPEKLFMQMNSRTISFGYEPRDTISR